MKTCTKCQTGKKLTDFFVQNKNTGRLHAECKDCYRLRRISYSAEHYKKYGDAYRERAKIRRRMIKTGLQQNMTAYLLDKGCTECGENDPRVLDFDHIDPKLKSFGISQAITKGFAWEMILDEITKCRILCANCHRKHTATQQGWYRALKTSE